MLVLLSVLSFLALALADTEGCPSVGTVITLDASVKADILARHNAERAKAHGYVPPLVWDAALEATAQNWAKQCNVAHNGNRAQDTWGAAYDSSRPKSVGENIANANGFYVGEYGMNFFIGEGKDYNCQTNTCSGGCGHYTQVMWAKTTKVGCAIVACSQYQYLVCDYGEAGNYNNERPFPVEGCYSYTAPPEAQYGCGPFFLSGSPPSSPPSTPPPTYSPPPPTYSPPPPPPPSGAPGCGLSIPPCPAGYYTSSSSSSNSNNNGVTKSTSSVTYNQGSSVMSYSLTTNMGPGSAVSQTLQITSRSGGGSSQWSNTCSRS